MTYPPRLFNCARCTRQVKICSHCDRGQVYCAGNCPLQARKESLNRAGQRYQTSQQGGLNHAARQARYRARQQQKVTHQGSAGKADHGSLMQQLKRLLDGIESRATQLIKVIDVTQTCDFCGQPCSPYVRWVFLSDFTSRNTF